MDVITPHPRRLRPAREVPQSDARAMPEDDARAPSRNGDHAASPSNGRAAANGARSGISATAGHAGNGTRAAAGHTPSDARAGTARSDDVVAHGAGIRPEIQALRALAVSLVVAWHLWPNGVPGGFVGVDAFFAISGFLITTLILREVEAT
jgi:hypothetical protein